MIVADKSVIVIGYCDDVLAFEVIADGLDMLLLAGPSVAPGPHHAGAVSIVQTCSSIIGIALE